MTTAQDRGPADPPFTDIKHVETIEAYDQWAEVYDTDGNFLQALDSVEMKTLLPRFLGLVYSSASSTSDDSSTRLKSDSPTLIVDLGCGTGRNTLALRDAVLGREGDGDGQGQGQTRIVGLEPSEKMLAIARQRVGVGVDVSGGAANVSFERFDIPITDNDVGTDANTNTNKNTALDSKAHGLISTLVLEHVPLRNFFRAASSLLRPSGVLLLTNMHSEMGAISQAGFVHPATGVKIRPTSYAHAIDEVVDVAAEEGFEVLGGMREVGVEEGMVGELGPRAAKWVGVRVWFGGCLRKRGM